jgi:hypothetical protein
MAPFKCLLLLVLFSTILLSPAAALSYINNPDANFHHEQNEPSRYRTHIVLIQPPAQTDVVHHRWHESFLPATPTDSGEPHLMHSYTEVFSGFAVRLTNAELDAATKKLGFMCAFPD